MSVTTANCPSCGALITFKISTSLVVVCEFCRSVVARTDRNLEDLGKVAALIDTHSALAVGLKGRFQGIAFEITGRAQLAHQMGGVWDEWYAAFSDGRWGWLSEAQGRFYLTFARVLPEPLPPFESLYIGHPPPGIQTPVRLTVAEKGVGQYLTAEGEIPFRLTPGEQYYYADLSGSRGEFATLDYSEQVPLIFIGREVTLDDIGIKVSAGEIEREKRVLAAQVSCPNCGGALELRAPDRAERVSCPYCDSLLDVDRGNLRYLKTLKNRREPVIPLGAVAEFEGVQLTVVGFMVRSCKIEGTRYYWEEYLLYNPRVGFRWLVLSDNHWAYVQPVSPGEVEDHGATARFRGKRFKRFQEAVARVEYVMGEFYWKVQIGEQAHATDLIRPPEMLSKEISVINPSALSKGKRAGADLGEVNWSLGVYVTPGEIQKKFGLKELARPETVGPCQPFPHKGVYKYWRNFLLIAIFLGMAFLIMGPRREVFWQAYELAPLKNADEPQVIFSDQFQLAARQNIKVTASAAVDNSWLYVEGDLINEETGLVQAFNLPIEYYHGVEGGEAWSEGGQQSTIHLSSLPAGRYTLRIAAQWQHWQQPATVAIRIQQGYPRALHIVLLVIALSIIPVIVLFRHLNFERRRWQESMFNPYE